MLHCLLQGQDAFARAAVDVFEFGCKGVGQMRMLRVSHNNTGAHPDWHLEQVMHFKPFLPSLQAYCVAHSHQKSDSSLEGA